MQQRFFIADLIACSTCFGHHYTHHQELKSIIQWLLQHPANRTHNPQLHTRTATWKPQHEIPQAATTVHTLELLMMGIVVPETCWASNKICNKKTSVASSWHFISTYVPWQSICLPSSLRFPFLSTRILTVRTWHYLFKARLALYISSLYRFLQYIGCVTHLTVAAQVPYSSIL